MTTPAINLPFLSRFAFLVPVHSFLKTFTRSKPAVVALVFVVVLFTVAILAPWVSPQNPYDLRQLSILNGRLPPMTERPDGGLFLLGTDSQGRDILSAIIFGLRTSFTVALSAGVLALLIGMFVGLTAAYVGGRIDAFLMRIVDLMLGFPTILITLILLVVLGRGVEKVILALVVVQWAYYARTARAAALVEVGKEYIEAARGLGLSHFRIVINHLAPNCLAPLIVVATVQVANAISLEATLSFLGIGLPVTEPSLGLLIANGFRYLLSGLYWISFFPGIALVIVVVAINVVGDRAREILNPRGAN